MRNETQTLLFIIGIAAPAVFCHLNKEGGLLFLPDYGELAMRIYYCKTSKGRDLFVFLLLNNIRVC